MGMKRGDVFGQWVVLEETRHRNRIAANVQCACGALSTVLKTNLVTGRSTRCLKCSYRVRGPRTGAKQRIPGEHLAAKDKFSDYKVKARKRNLDFELSFDEFMILAKSDCIYCGEKPSNVNRVPWKNWAQDFVYSGIDRRDNSIGYTVDNSVPCCKMCNYSKRDLTYEEFVERARRIAAHAGRKS